MLAGMLAVVGSPACGGFEPRREAARLAAESVAEGRFAELRAEPGSGEEAQRRARRRVVTHLARAGRQPQPDDEAAAGLLALFDGQPRRSVALLASAAERSASWQDRNDLAVVHLERHHRGEGPLHLVQALDLLQAAERAAPGRPEVVYNRALVLSRLHLRRAAEDAWQRVSDMAVFRRDAAAARRRSELVAPSRFQRWQKVRAGLFAGPPLDLGACRDLVDRFPLFAREYARLELAASWSRAVLESDGDSARRALELGDCLGIAAETRLGDPSIVRLYRYLHECPSTGDVRCAEAHLRLAGGVEAFLAGRYGDAEALLSRSVGELRDLDSPSSAWGEYFLAYATFHRGIDSTQRWLDGLLEEASAAPDPLLLGRLHWRLGVAAGSARSPSRALLSLDRGTAMVCAEAGDADCAFGGLLAAEIYDLAGDPTAGWSRRLPALEGVARLGSPRQLHSALSLTAQALVRQGYAAASEPFVQELVLHAEETGNPELMTEALRDRGRMLAVSGRPDAAGDDFAGARRSAAPIGASHRQRHLLCTLDLEEGASIAGTEPRRAVRLLDRALAKPECSGNPFYRLLALTHRARAFRAAGDDQRRERDLLAVLDLFERQRQASLDESRYLSLVGAQPVFDELIRLLVAGGRAGDALTVAERSRNRFLLEARVRSSRLGEPLAAAQIASLLPADSLLVQYADLGDELAVWVVERGSVRATLLPLDRPRLLRALAQLRHGMAQGRTEAELEPWSTDLHSMLLRGLGVEPEAHARLVVVPDRVLLDVPFAALSDARTGRLLIEDVAVTTSPSSSLVLVAPQRTGREGRRPALIVAAPDLSGTPGGDSLPPVPGALREAAMVHGMFPRATVLSGGEATRSAFLWRAPSAAFVHFAGHALADRDAPLRSRLPFAREQDRDSELVAAQVLELRMDTPLVVLSACSTLQGFAPDRENLLGLAGAFYAAGSGAVVATLGPAVDGARIDILGDFYRAYGGGAGPSEALRQAVLRHRRSSSPGERRLQDWADLVVVEELTAQRAGTGSDGREAALSAPSERSETARTSTVVTADFDDGR